MAYHTKEDEWGQKLGNFLIAYNSKDCLTVTVIYVKSNENYHSFIIVDSKNSLYA